MKITPRKPSDVLTFKLGITHGSGGPRSTGLHLSDIYNAMLKDLYPERYARFKGDDDSLELFGEMGFAVEHILERGLKCRHASRPEEHQTEEGIYFSPDLIIYDDDGRIFLGEIKAAWMSSRDVPRIGDPPGFGSFPPKFDKYLIQTKGYCRSLGTPHARLFVFFVNGKYDCKNKGEDLKPELHIWDLTFTDAELEENWRMLMNYAKSRGML